MSSTLSTALTALGGGVVGGAFSLAGVLLTGYRNDKSAVAREQRERDRTAADEIRSAQKAAAVAVMSGLAAMRDLWTGERSNSLEDNAHRLLRLWDLHEEVRVAALTLPARERTSVATAAQILRFAHEIGGDDLRPGGFIFMGQARVAQETYEAIYEELSRFIAGDSPLPWPEEAQRVLAARDDWLPVRADDYQDEHREYVDERAEFDTAHPGLAERLAESERVRR